MAHLTLLTLAFTLSIIASIVLTAGLIVALPAALGFLGFGSWVQLASRTAGFVLLLAVLIAGLAALYHWGPSRKRTRWIWVVPGVTLAVTVAYAASSLFVWYLTSFGSYDATYGSLGALFGFMSWIWITAIIIVVGAEFNSEIESQARKDGIVDGVTARCSVPG